MRDRLQHAEGRGLLGGGDVGDIGDRCSGYARRGQERLPLGRRSLTEAIRQERHERLAIAHAVGVRTEARVGERARAARGRRREREQAVVPAGDHQLAVARGEDLVRRHHREDRALPRRHRAVREIADEVVADVAERGLVERGVDERALAGPLAFEERRDDPERGPDPGAHVDQRRADADAGSPGLSRHADEAAGRLHERVVAGLVRERAGRGRTRRPSSTRAAGCARAAPPAPEPETVGEPRAEALQEDVGLLGEPEHRLRPRSSASETASERLPAFTDRNIALSPFQNGGPHARPSSPVSGRSTLTTSAPSAARISAQYGPAIDVVTSTTLTPASGRNGIGGSSPLCEDARVPTGSTSTRSPSGSRGAWWSYFVIFGVAVVDAFFPLVPSETVVVIGGTFAASGDLNLLLVILAGAAGAILGDNISFGIGHWSASEP